MTGSLDRNTFLMTIGSEAREASDGRWIANRNPATGEELARVPLATEEDVDAAVAAARSAFEGGKWSRTAAAKRGKLLNQLADRLTEQFDDLAALECRDSGKAITSVKGEIGQAIAELEFFAGAATKIRGETTPTPHGFLNYTIREPLGVCGLIVPWNYPFLLAMRKVAPALAAGNAVVLKPASETPLSALFLGELAAQVGFPEGALNVITGPGRTVGSALATHPDVAKVSFTGSTENGRHILRAAAEDFRRVTLELGGKSPNIVFADADMASAVAGSVWAIFYSAGQSCEARSRVFVERAAFDEFVERFVAATRRLVVGDPLDPNTHLGSLISASHLEGVMSYVDEAASGGATVRTGGSRPDDPALAAGHFLAPTVLTDVSNSDRVCQEEVFGPVVTIVPFDGEPEAIAMANDTIYGLAASLWTGSATRAVRVAGAIRSGVVTVNQPYTVFPGTPFGGFKQSGWGREASLDALHDYTELKSVVTYAGTRPIDPFGLG